MSNETFSSLKAEHEKLHGALLEKAKMLVDSVESGDLSGSVEIINTLYQYRHEVFYREVGTLTRALHESIKTFSVDVNSHLGDQDGSPSAMNDASGRLAHVIELTETHTHETLDRVDQSLSLISRLSRRENLPDDVGADLQTLNQILNEILVSQSFQDITGQLIKRVMTLLTDLESQLVALIEMAGKIENLRGIESGLMSSSDDSLKHSESSKNTASKTVTAQSEVKAEGPQIDKDAKNVVKHQDDVDDLLSSLGF